MTVSGLELIRENVREEPLTSEDTVPASVALMVASDYEKVLNTLKDLAGNRDKIPSSEVLRVLSGATAPGGHSKRS